MSDYTKLETKMDKRFDEMMALMNKFANDVNTRFDANDVRFDRLEERLDKFEASHHKLINTIDGFIKRIDDYETELAARDHKIERLERWIEQIATKTGVKLS